MAQDPTRQPTLLVAAGSNPERLDSEASFASLYGVNPISASSGKTNRHRLNRGGHRQANAAGAQFMADELIAPFEFEQQGDDI